VAAAASLAGEPAAATAKAWCDAVSPRALDWGAKFPLAGGACQLYARWQIERADVEAVLAAAGAATGNGAPSVASALRTLDRSFAQMLGVELRAGHDPTHVVYVSTPNLGSRTAAALGRVVGDRLGGTAWPARWDALAAALVRADSHDDPIYVSFEANRPTGWVKVDVGDRPVADVDAVAEILAASEHVPVARALLAALGVHRLSHVGVRLRPDGESELSVYARALP
jgi:hypothetical protein